MTIEEQVLSVIASNTEDKAALSLETRFRTQMRLDSFGLLIVINALEETFGITLSEEDFRNTETIGEIAQLVKQRLGGASTPDPVQPEHAYE